MEVIDREQAHKEAREAYDIIWKAVQDLPEHLAKSKLWANSITYALLNILVRVYDATNVPWEQFLAMASEVWNGFHGKPKEPQKPSAPAN